MVKDLRAAFVTAVLSVAYSLSTSALIFSGPIQKFLGLGIAAALVTATTAALVTSFGSGFRIAISSPTSTIAAALAVTIASLDPLLATLPPGRAVPLVFVTLGITTVATGSVLVLLGIGRLGMIIRFIPFPVVAGFMATSGWLLASGAIRMTAQVPLTFQVLHELQQPSKAFALSLAVLWAGFLAIVTKRFKGPAIMPCLLIGAVVLVNGVLAVIKMRDPSATIYELMFHADTRLAIELPFFSGMISQVDWPALLSLAPNILAVIFITVLTALLTCTGLESALDVDSDLDHELKIQGAANIVSGLGGGYVGLISVGTTMAARSAGAIGRLTGIVTALICLVMLLGGMTLLNDIPRFIVGGLQLFLGTQVLWTWCIASRKKMPITEWLLVLCILAIAVWFGFVPAILSGILGGCIIFAMDVSRINVIRRVYSINERGSALVRSTDEVAVLSREGASAKIVELNGYIFFGSAYQMLSSVKGLVAAGGLQVLVLDFTGVTGGDSSAAAVLGRLDKLLKRENIVPIFAGARPEIFALFQNSGTLDRKAGMSRDRDTALQEAENRVLARAGTPQPSTIPLAAWLARSLGSLDLAEALVPLLQRADVPAGTYLCRQGEPTDTLMYIETGRVGVMIGSGESEVAVRIFGPHTVAGEQGFILRQPRSASLKVEEDARVWSLPRAAYDQLVHSNADLAIALMRDIVRVQSERLSFATRQAAALAG